MAFFYNDTNFRNVVYTVNDTILNYLATKYLKGDTTRVVWSSNAYALRARYEQLTKQNYSDSITTFNFNCPFINFRLSDITIDTNRNWKNYVMSSQGVYVEELKRNLKLLPVKLSYESTFFTDNNLDNIYIANEIIADSTPETIIPYDLQILSQTMPQQGIFSYNHSFASDYNEQEWLEKNKIYNQNLDFSIDVFLIKDRSQIVSLSKTIFLNFRVQNNLGDITDEETDKIMEDTLEIL